MRFDRRLLLATAALALAAPPLAMAQSPSPAPVGLAMTVFPAKDGKTLKVTTPAFADGGDIPFENTRYRGNIFPGLAWTKGPRGTKSYAVIMQDADVNFRGGPLLHWTMYDIPATATKLDAGMTTPPAGSSYGPNVRGPNQAYFGPHTPPGARHHYHFAIFALDQSIPVDPALTYDAMAAAMQGHVLASGEVVGIGQADPSALPATPVAPSNSAAH